MAHVCFVCNKDIRLTGIAKDNAVYIGNNLYRHKEKCAPLSVSYNAYEQRIKDSASTLLNAGAKINIKCEAVTEACKVNNIEFKDLFPEIIRQGNESEAER